MHVAVEAKNIIAEKSQSKDHGCITSVGDIGSMSIDESRETQGEGS
jgi:hypothetical protein